MRRTASILTCEHSLAIRAARWRWSRPSLLGAERQRPPHYRRRPQRHLRGAGPRGEYVVFVVRDRQVRDLNFNIQITCQASDSAVTEQRFFTAGLDAPTGPPYPRQRQV